MLLVAVVEDLELHAHERRISLERAADGEAVVGPGGELEVEPQHEVAELLHGHERVADAFLRADLAVDHPVADGIFRCDARGVAATSG